MCSRPVVSMRLPIPAVPHRISVRPCQWTSSPSTSARWAMASITVAACDRAWSSPAASARWLRTKAHPPTPVNSPHPAQPSTASAMCASIQRAPWRAASSQRSSPSVRKASPKNNVGAAVPHPKPGEVSGFTPGCTGHDHPSFPRSAVARSHSPTLCADPKQSMTTRYRRVQSTVVDSTGRWQRTPPSSPSEHHRHRSCIDPGSGSATADPATVAS